MRFKKPNAPYSNRYALLGYIMRNILHILGLIILFSPQVNGQIIDRIINFERVNSASSDSIIFIDSLSTIDFNYYYIGHLTNNPKTNENITNIISDSEDSIYNINFVYKTCCGEPFVMDNSKLTVNFKKEMNKYNIRLYDYKNNLLLEGISYTVFPFNWTGELTKYYSNGKIKQKTFHVDTLSINKGFWTWDGVLIDTVFSIDDVDIEPSFNHSDESFNKSFSNYLPFNITYPKKALNLGFMGRVYISFIITKTGQVTCVEILRGIHPLLDNECVRVIESLPDMNPGIFNGEKVNTRFYYPIHFNRD